MDGSIEAVTSGIEAMTERYRSITHNLANANTAGFKRQLGSLIQLAPIAGQQVVEPGEIVTGQISGLNSIDFTQGVLVKTGRTLDGRIHDEMPNRPDCRVLPSAQQRAQLVTEFDKTFAAMFDSTIGVDSKDEVSTRNNNFSSSTFYD